MKHFRLVVFSVFFLEIISCHKSKDPWGIQGIGILKGPVIIKDFSADFYSDMELFEVKEKYPFFFSSDIPDSIWISKKTDALELKLFQKTQATFPNNETLKKELPPLFERMKYLYEDFSLPDTYTYISKIDYIYPVLYTGKYLFIGLDNFLGANDKTYENIPQYIRRNMSPKQLLPTIARVMARKKIPYNGIDGTFLNMLIYQGKILLLIDRLLPESPETVKIGYSSKEIDWCRTNESELWKYWVENKLLFSKDNQLYERFIAPAPFSKFYTDADHNSPGRVGTWVGWQIMRLYWRNHPERKLRDILEETDYKKIFAQSGYKPKKNDQKKD